MMERVILETEGVTEMEGACCWAWWIPSKAAATWLHLLFVRKLKCNLKSTTTLFKRTSFNISPVSTVTYRRYGPKLVKLNNDSSLGFVLVLSCDSKLESPRTCVKRSRNTEPLCTIQVHLSIRGGVIATKVENLHHWDLWNVTTNVHSLGCEFFFLSWSVRVRVREREKQYNSFLKVRAH